MSAAAPSPSLPSEGSVVARKFEVVRLLGQGGMGAVYEVRHTRTHRRFALKWMVPALAQSAEAMNRFVREARTSCAIEHPNLVSVIDVDSADGAMFMLMELLRGEPLSDRVGRGPIPAKELIPLLLPALHGLHEAHERGIVHRDLKPENVYLAQARPGLPIRAKILDFGISKLAGNEQDSHIRLTATGVMMGTPVYMAPEQARDAAQVDARADIYSFGAVLYECLTGRPPHEAESLTGLLLKIVTEEPVAPSALQPEVPVEVSAVVMRALSKTPDGRPQTTEQLARELCDAVNLPFDFFAPSGSTSAREATGRQPLPTGPSEAVDTRPLPGEPTGGPARPSGDEVHLLGLRRGRLALMGVAALLVLAGAVAALAFGSSGPNESEPADGEAVAADPAEPSVEPEPTAVESAVVAPTPAPPAVGPAAAAAAEVATTDEAAPRPTPMTRRRRQPRAMHAVAMRPAPPSNARPTEAPSTTSNPMRPATAMTAATRLDPGAPDRSAF